MNNALLKSIVTTIALYTSSTVAQETYSRFSYDISHGLTRFSEKIRIKEPDRFTSLNPSMDQKDFIRNAKTTCFNSVSGFTISYKIVKCLSFIFRPELGIWGTLSLREELLITTMPSRMIQKSLPTSYWALPIGTKYSIGINSNINFEIGLLSYINLMFVKKEITTHSIHDFLLNQNETTYEISKKTPFKRYYLRPYKDWSNEELLKYNAQPFNPYQEKYDPNPRLVCTIPMSIIYRWKSIRFGLHYEYGFSLKYDKVMQEQYPAESSYRLHGYRFSLGLQLKKGSIGRFMKKLDEWVEPPK